MSHTGKLFLIALSALVLAGGTAAQVPDSGVSVTGTLGSIGQSSTLTGPFKFDNSHPDLSLAARIERGKALPKYEGPLASPEWLQRNCHATYRPGSSGPVSREQCIEQLAAAMPAFDPNKPRHFGERYSPKTWRDCRLNAHDFGGLQGRYAPGDCDWYKLRRIENPTFWPYEHNKDFKWPEAPKESVYRPGMTSEAYHKALCEKESGQWVYKRVEGVKSIYLVRPYRTSLGQDYQRDRFVEEAPFLVFDSATLRPESMVTFAGDRTSNGREFPGFDFVEMQFEKSRSVGRQGYSLAYKFAGQNPGEPDFFSPKVGDYFLGRMMSIAEIGTDGQKRYAASMVRYELEFTQKIVSWIGIVWRDIEREQDRDLSVGGTEVAVVDLQTNEILGLYRTFVLQGRSWEGSQRCDWYRTERAQLVRFVSKVVGKD